MSRLERGSTSRTTCELSMGLAEHDASAARPSRRLPAARSPAGARCARAGSPAPPRSPGRTGFLVSRRKPSAAEAAEGLLHLAVLEAVEGDDHHPAAGGEAAGEAPEGLAQPLQLAVHVDAQGLERAGGGVEPGTAAAAERRAHDRRQLASSCAGAAARARPRSRARCAARPAPRRSGRCRSASSSSGMRFTTSAAVSPWLRSMRMSRGPSRWKLKPALGVVELRGADAEVEEDAVGRLGRRGARGARGSRRGRGARARRTARGASRARSRVSASRSTPSEAAVGRARASGSPRRGPPRPTVPST